MSALIAMREALQNPAEFQRYTMIYYRALVMDMLSDPRYHQHRTALFGAIRTITEWQRNGSDEFVAFYTDYVTVTKIVDDVMIAVDQQALDILEAQP